MSEISPAEQPSPADQPFPADQPSAAEQPSVVDDVRVALRCRRRELGLSQAGLATRAGVSQSTVSRVERGSDDVRLDLVERLTAAVGLRLAVLDDAGRPYPQEWPAWVTATDTGGALLPVHLEIEQCRLLPLRTFLRRMKYTSILGPDDVWVYYRRPPD